MEYHCIKTRASANHSLNQDAACILSALIAGKKVHLCLVCDGVGGLKHGECASSTCVESITFWFVHTLPVYLSHWIFWWRIKNSLRKLLSELNEQLYLSGQGTTFSMILKINHQVLYFHVGDSKILLLSEHVICLTREDRVEGTNILWQCLGSGEKLKIQSGLFHCKKDCIFLLGTDGFFEKLTENEVKRELVWDYIFNPKSLEHCCERLLSLGEFRGAKDDATVGVLVLGKAPNERGEIH